MSLLKTILSIGAGIITAAASYVLMSSNKSESNSVNNQNNRVNDAGSVNQTPAEINKSEKILKKLDKIQIALVNFARFASEVIRSVSLFIRAMKCYEYDNSYQPYQR